MRKWVGIAAVSLLLSFLLGSVSTAGGERWETAFNTHPAGRVVGGDPAVTLIVEGEYRTNGEEITKYGGTDAWVERCWYCMLHNVEPAKSKWMRKDKTEGKVKGTATVKVGIKLLDLDLHWNVYTLRATAMARP